jgi:hypothetical protein
MEGRSHGLLFGLSANTPQYEYQSRAHFLSTQQQELGHFHADENSRSEYIIFTGIDQDTFLNDIANLTSSIETYSAALQVILIKMESHAHAVAHERFSFQMANKLRDMDLDWQLIPFGAAPVEGEDRRKRADQSYRPKHFPRDRPREWPTFVIETAYSESQQKLQGDIRWWLRTTQGSCCVVTISINQRMKEIAFEKWAGYPRPKRMYRTVLTQSESGENIRATNTQPLVIRFEEVFLTQPAAGENDFTFDMEELMRMVAEIWDAQFPPSA